MRFIIQIPQLIYAGAEKVLVSFANDLVCRGHEVEILESYDRGYLKSYFDKRVTFHCICSKDYTSKYYASFSEVKNEKNIIQKIIKSGKLIFSKVVGYRRFAEKLAAKRYKDRCFDVAINYLEIESPEFLLNHIHADKYIQWYHTDVANINNPEETDKMIQYYEKMDAIICVAKSAKENFIERYPQLKQKTYVIYNYYDSEIIQDRSKESFQFNNYENGVPILLSVGRMTPQKKYIRFLNVLYRLKNENIKFQWYVLGDGIDRNQIELEIQNLNLQDCVFLEGICDNPYKYMAHCDLFVLPSGWEGFPTVTIEAKILNCAVIATDVSGIREQMIHGKTGWIVDNDENSIYEGLKFLLSNPLVLQKIRSNEGMESIISNENKYQIFMKI